MNWFTWNIASGRARAVAHMTLPAAGRFMPEFDTSQHHGQTHVLEVSIGIIGDGAVGSVILLCDRALQGRRREAFGSTRSEGATHGRDGQLETPALVNDDMSLRGMHAHTLSQWSASVSEKVSRPPRFSR